MKNFIHTNSCHAQEDSIKDYIKRLRNPKTKDDYVLREKFIEKMNFITNS